MRAARRPRPSAGKADAALTNGSRRTPRKKHNRHTRASLTPQICGTRTNAVKHGHVPYTGKGVRHTTGHAKRVAARRIRIAAHRDRRTR
jgi:hypothetical protein